MEEKTIDSLFNKILELDKDGIKTGKALVKVLSIYCRFLHLNANDYLIGGICNTMTRYMAEDYMQKLHKCFLKGLNVKYQIK